MSKSIKNIYFLIVTFYLKNRTKWDEIILLQVLKKLILYFSIFKSYSFSLENKLQLPIIKLALNGQNLGEVEKIIISKLLSEKEFILPQIYLSENITFLGNINLLLDNMSLTISNNTETFLNFIEEDNINININKLKGKIIFNYQFKSNFITGEGNGTILINNLKLKVNNTLIQIPNAHETDKEITGIKIDSLTIDDFELELTFSKNGTFEKTMKYFYKNLKKFLLNVMEIELNKVDAINNINDKLYTLFRNINMNIPLKLMDIDDEINFSFAINEKPIIKNNFLEFSIKGEIKGNNYVYDEINNITLPCIIDNIELISNKTINSILSQFIFNNALDVLYFFGKFNLEITNDTMGISELSVGFLSGFIREIINGYKSNQTAKIITNSIASPILNINNNNKIKFYLNENIKIFVYNETQSGNKSIGTIPVDADTVLEINSDFDINDKDIQIKINSIQMISFEVQKSLVGDINIENVKTNFNNLINLYLSRINNEIKNLIDSLKQKIVNYEGINLSDLYAKSYENYLKFDLSPILVSLFQLIYF